MTPSIAIEAKSTAIDALSASRLPYVVTDAHTIQNATNASASTATCCQGWSCSSWNATTETPATATRSKKSSGHEACRSDSSAVAAAASLMCPSWRTHPAARGLAPPGSRPVQLVLAFAALWVSRRR
ncbi:MAG: hypothetical protein NVV57_09705 [Demequina sp.]|nr:hypothetical protein [Demequina sp.]